MNWFDYLFKTRTSGQFLVKHCSCCSFRWNVKGATKSYFMHYSCVVIVLFNTALCRSAFFYMSSFRKLFFRLSVLSLNEDIKICVIMYVILNLFSTYVKTHLLVNNKLFKNVLYIVLLCKNLVSEMFWFFQKKRIYKEKWNSHKIKSVKKLGKSHKTV